MDEKLERQLPGLTAEAYARIKAAHATVTGKLEKDWRIILEEPNNPKWYLADEETFYGAWRELYEDIATEYIATGPDREACLKGLDHTEQFIRSLRHPNPHWNTTWGERARNDVVEKTREHWRHEAKREWPRTESKPQEALGAQLKKARTKAKQSREAAGMEIAELIGRNPFSAKEVSRWETGEVKNPQPPNCDAIDKYIQKYLP